MTALVALLLAAGIGHAQPAVPEGLPLGPWVLTPSLSSSYEVDSNLFRFSEELQSGTRRQKISSFSGSLGATLPFRNSMLQLNYVGTKRGYETISSDRAQDFGVLLQLNFSSGDQLILRDDFRRDTTRLRELDTLGNEVTFNGEPYHINAWQVQLGREIPGRQGYEIRVRRTDFNFKGDSDVGFFDFRGFETATEYRQPLSSGKWWVFHYGMRRFNNYEPNTPEYLVTIDGILVHGGFGVPFRKEESDRYQVGLRGRLSRDQSFFVRTGYVQFGLEQFSTAVDTDEDGVLERVPGFLSEFDGLSGEANWRLKLGPATDLELGFLRLPLPSGFETFYIINELRAELGREIARRARLSVTARVGRNDYGDPISQGSVFQNPECQDYLRKDDRLDVETNFTWLLYQRLGLRLQALHERRGSNCGLNDYTATQIGAGITLGWF